MANKNIFSAIIFASLALLTVSCNKEAVAEKGNIEIVNGELKSFTGLIDEEFTKAYVDGVSGEVSWEEGDRIMVSSGGSNTQVFEYNSTKKIFEHTESNGVKDNGIGFVMIYPADIFTDADFAGNTFTVHVNLPASQTLKEHGSCNKPPMMANCAPIAAGNRGTVQFKSICGILGFPVTGDIDKGDFASVSFKGAGACGAGTLTCSGGAGSSLVPNLTMSDPSTEKTVTITDTGTTSESTPVWYYMYLPPKTYSSPKITVTFADGNVDAVDRTVTSLPITRNNITWAAQYFQTIFGGGGSTGEQSGTAAAPYLIKTENDLIELAAKVNQTDPSYVTKASGVPYSSSGKYYKLANDITLTAAFTPIGTDDHPFEGILVGNNCTISGLTLTGASANRGLFGVVSGATISNLTISSPSVTGGTNFIGALAGKAVSSTINSVTVSGGTVSGSGNTVGGLVGLFNGGTISSCSSTCAVSGASFIGGVIGAASAGSISSCNHTSGAVSGTNQHVGGVVGSLTGLSNGSPSYSASTATMTSCNANCAVSSTPGNSVNAYTGGVCGSANGSGTIINTCKMQGGSVTSNGYNVAGVVGELNGGGTMQGASNDDRSTNAATVSGYQHVGGICNVWNGTLKWYNNSGKVTGTLANIGGICGRMGTGGTCTVTYCGNSGTLATGATEATNVTNMGGVVGVATGTGTISYCSNSAAISTEGRCIGGIVGRVTGATDITNCTHNKNVTSTGYFVGGIAGQVTISGGGAGIRSCTVTNCTISTSATDYGIIGGIVGDYDTPTSTSGDVTDVIYRCEAKDLVVSATSASGNYGACGAIAGRIERGSRIIECCSRQNKMIAPTICGGIAGFARSTTDRSGHTLVRNCLSQDNWIYGSSTSAKNNLGGIIGQINQAASTGSVRVTECISDCNLFESKHTSANWGACSGGIIGYINGDGASVGIRNSFVNYYQSTSKNPGGSGKCCFLLSRTAANGSAGAGGFVGYYGSGDTGVLNIYNCGARMTYGCWSMGGTAITTANYLSNWKAYGISPVVGRVYQGKIVLRAVFWCTVVGPYSFNTFHENNSITDVRSDDSTNSFEVKGESSYFASCCLNESFQATYCTYTASGTAGTVTTGGYSEYWTSSFNTTGRKPTRSRWGTNRYQAVTMLNYTEGQTYGYERTNTYVNENMGYTGHNWVHTNDRLTANSRWYPGGVWWGNTASYAGN